MSHCPKCNSKDVRRSRTQSRWERWRKEITGKRLYRCRSCNWRGWMVVDLAESHRATSRSTAPDTPNLPGTVPARPEPVRQIDLTELDRFHGPADKGDA